MYRLDWLEQLKLRQAHWPEKARLAGVSPVVWSLGLVSCLTDISSEMVNSILPVYVVLHLRLSPLQYGAIDGVYNGLSVALVSVAAGLLADRWSRHKEVAAAGYGLSALCKLLLLAAGGLWASIMAVVALDRLGKGMRTAPRDALISLYSSPALYGTAFGVHRMLDSAGALLGPIVAFALLAQVPGDFDVLWMVSFLVAVLGLAALWLFVPGSASRREDAPESQPKPPPLVLPRPFVLLAACGTLLAVVTISDGFVYLLLQQKGAIDPTWVPLFFVLTAASYMLFAIPVGIAADRFGRSRVFLAGYLALLALYALLWALPVVPLALVIGSLVLLGLYYAGTEGVLMAGASALVPTGRRTTHLAILGTGVGLGKLLSSLLFGWTWQQLGSAGAVGLFVAGMIVALVISASLLEVRHAAA
jgi:MFS family permease